MNQWTDKINEITASFNQLEVDRKEKPQRNGWNPTEIIDHLVTVNTSYFPIFDLLMENNYQVPFLGRSRFLANAIGREILKSVNPNTRKKIKTFKIWEPTNIKSWDAAILQFKEHQNNLIKYIEDLTPVLEKNPIISSPANRHITYPLKTAFDIIVTHEDRHLIQTKNYLSSLELTNK